MKANGNMNIRSLRHLESLYRIIEEVDIQTITRVELGLLAMDLAGRIIEEGRSKGESL